MEFQINRDVLHSALSVLSAVAARKATIPILSNVLMRTNGKDTLMLVASDLATTVVYHLPCEATREGGITLNAKQLADVVGSCSGDEVKLSSADLKAELRCGRSRFSLAGLHERDFPKIPDTSKAVFGSVDAAALVDLIDKVAYAVSSDDNRANLAGGNLSCSSGKLHLCGSDGHRAVLAHHKSDASDFKDALIPKAGLAYLKRAIEGATGLQLARNADHVIAKAGNVLACVKLLDATFPPLDQFIRKESPISIAVIRADFLSVVRRVALVAGAKNAVALQLDKDTLTISAKSESGNADESIPVDYDGKPFTVGCSAAYLIEALDKADGETLLLELEKWDTPLQLCPESGDEFMALLMPMDMT